MHQRLQHLHAVGGGGVGGAQHAGEVAVPPGLRAAHPPAYAFTHGGQTHRGGALVVTLQLIGVAGIRRHVERHATQVDVVGALETGHPIRLQAVVTGMGMGINGLIGGVMHG